jgi:GT2 family glycosyltransferase
MRYHQMYENTVVIGPMLTPNDFDMFPWVRWEQSMLMKQYDALAVGEMESSARQFYTGNASLMRTALISAGGFDTTFQRAEDVELAYRLADMGLNFEFNPDAIGYHYAERSFSSWLQIPYAYGRNDVIFAQQKKQDWLLPTIFREYKGRNFIVRAITSLCLDHKLTTDLTVSLLTQMASIGHAIGQQSVPRMAYSGIFNLKYYQGVADELGGRDKFYN